MGNFTKRSLAFAATILVVTGMASAQRAPLSHDTGSKIAGSAGDDEEVAAANSILQADKQSVRIGSMPPEILEYDVRLVALVTEAKRAMAAHDLARARQFPKLYADLMAARNSVYQKFAAESIARNSAIANGLRNARPNPNVGLGQKRRPPSQSGGDQGWCQQGSGSATPGGYVPCE